jgi:hypothetical protein
MKWLDRYTGQSTEQLVSLESEYRIDSLVVAMEQALGQKAAHTGEQSLSNEERVVLAVEALEREVNNGGYRQFFLNSAEYARPIADSLVRIGCPQTAAIAQEALDALKPIDLNAESIQNALGDDTVDLDEKLSGCDSSYFNTGEDIAGSLFAFVKANQTTLNLQS